MDWRNTLFEPINRTMRAVSKRITWYYRGVTSDAVKIYCVGLIIGSIPAIFLVGYFLVYHMSFALVHWRNELSFAAFCALCVSIYQYRFLGLLRFRIIQSLFYGCAFVAFTLSLYLLLVNNEALRNEYRNGLPYKAHLDLEHPLQLVVPFSGYFYIFAAVLGLLLPWIHESQNARKLDRGEPFRFDLQY
jgi:hypothetical protein